MKAAVLTLSLLLAYSSHQEQSSTESTSHLPAPNSTTAYDPFFSEGRAYWERYYMYHVDPHVPRVDVYDKDKSRTSIKVNIPRTNGDISLTDATITPEGKVIVSGSAMLVGGKHFQFVGVGNRDGRVSPLVDTARFVVTQVSTCDEGTVWTLGWLRAGPNLDEDSREPYPILRQYRLSDGKMLASALKRTSFAHHPTSRGVFQLPNVRMQCRGNILGIYEEPNEE